MDLDLPITITDEWDDDEKALVCCAHLLHLLREKCPTKKFFLSEKPFGNYGSPSCMLRFYIRNNRDIDLPEIRYSFENGKSYLAARNTRIANDLNELITYINNLY